MGSRICGTLGCTTSSMKSSAYLTPTMRRWGYRLDITIQLHNTCQDGAQPSDES